MLCRNAEFIVYYSVSRLFSVTLTVMVTVIVTVIVMGITVTEKENSVT
jgi:hypothetical protein